MTYRSLLVHVEPTTSGRARVRAAAALANEFGARLIGVGARSAEAMPDPIGMSVTLLHEAIAEELASAEKMFNAEAGAVRGGVQWRRFMRDPSAALLDCASGADIVVASRCVVGSPAEKQASGADLIMGAGLPVLTVPDGAGIDARRVLIAWKDAREARRAVSDALPLLARAQAVYVASFGEEGAEAPSDMTALVERLAAHGVKAEGEVIEKSGGVAAQIVASARERDCGLVVAGGYGHSRLQEWALGGVTRWLLGNSDLPVLFSH